MRARPAVSALAAAALLASAFGVLADHAQSGGGRSVAFDHVTGNEWWVEVRLTGADAAAVASVEAQDGNGPWTALAKRSWGPYAASFHVEPGNQVRFRATWAGGAQLVSCWFTHPAGAEQCGPASSTTSTGSSFDAAFTGVRGNEWWVQAGVAANRGLAKVEATLDGGATYKPLAKQSWGGWAASFRVVQGSTVQLRATSTDGATDLSPCHRWIPATSQTDATVVPCPWGTSSSTTTTTSSSTTSTTTPRVAWSTRTLAQMPGFHGPVVARDFDLDGDGDVVVLGEEGMHVLRPGGPVLLDPSAWWQGEVGSPGPDGSPALYVLGFPSGQESMELRRVTVEGDRVTSQRPIYGSHDPLGPFHIADLDGDYVQEIYVARGETSAGGQGFAAAIDRVDLTAASASSREVASLGDAGNGFLAVVALESIDIPGGAPTLVALALTFDGQDRLENRVLALRYGDGGVLHAQQVATFHDEPAFLEVLDVDRDGRPDVATGNRTDLLVLKAWPYSWSQSWGGPVPAGMLAGDSQDGDGDGYSDLYVAADDGRLYTVLPYHAGGLVAKAIATVATGESAAGPFHVAWGEGDTDSLLELYTASLAFDGSGAPVTRIVETGYGADTTGFDATFAGVKGNDWWVQVHVAANHPLAGVEARVDCGAWRPLALQSWGGWAASFHVPPGSRVEFRASSTGGGAEVSGAYVWPHATPTSPCYP